MDSPDPPSQRGRSVPSPYPSTTFGKIPASAWRAKTSAVALKVVLGGLAILSRGRSCWVQATQNELAAACGNSSKTVNRAIADLVAKGVVTWESIGSNFTLLLFRLKGQEGGVLRGGL